MAVIKCRSRGYKPAMEQVGELMLFSNGGNFYYLFFSWTSPKKMVGPHTSIVVAATSHVAARYKETKQMLSASSRHEVDVRHFTTYSDVAISQFVHELCITPHQASKTFCKFVCECFWGFFFSFKFLHFCPFFSAVMLQNACLKKEGDCNSADESLKVEKL